MNLHPKFVHEMTGNSEKLFSNPEIKAELSGPVRKKRHDTQLSAFNRLQNDAVRKLQELEGFVSMQVDVRFDEFKEKVKGVEFSRLLREGSTPSTVAGPAAAPPPIRPHRSHLKTSRGIPGRQEETLSLVYGCLNRHSC